VDVLGSGIGAGHSRCHCDCGGHCCQTLAEADDPGKGCAQVFGGPCDLQISSWKSNIMNSEWIETTKASNQKGDHETCFVSKDNVVLEMIGLKFMHVRRVCVSGIADSLTNLSLHSMQLMPRHSKGSLLGFHPLLIAHASCCRRH